MDLGTLLLLLGLSYGLGVLWYGLLPRTVPNKVWRVAAYPFVGIWAAEALIAPMMLFDPKFGGLHLVTVLIGSIVGVIVDWAIEQARRPVEVPRMAPQA
ncbi:MAG: hypothetical protein M1389_06215 [Chloroflexi bacterium]|nr:hypothetical protein [Chloroflexota bacterium]MDA8216416.1 hypothetical protein [Dehalococcoidales bacterium]